MQWKIPQFNDFHSTHKKDASRNDGNRFPSHVGWLNLERFTVFAHLYGRLQHGGQTSSARPHCSAWDGTFPKL
jgi:hypothetical protein